MSPLCLIGIHQWSIDAAVFIKADMCNRCSKYRDPLDEMMLARERALWGEVPPGMSFDHARRFVLDRLVTTR